MLLYRISLVEYINTAKKAGGVLIDFIKRVGQLKQQREQRLARETAAPKEFTSTNGALKNGGLTVECLEYDVTVPGRHGATVSAPTETEISMNVHRMPYDEMSDLSPSLNSFFMKGMKHSFTE